MLKFFKFKMNHSIFKRLIVTFLIVIIPIYMLGIVMYNWGLQTIKNEIGKSTTAQVSFYLRRLEDEIERMKILQYDCLNDENLQKLGIRSSIMDDYEIVESMRQLQQRLRTIKNSSAYIRDVSVYIPAIQKTITANTAANPFNTKRFKAIRSTSDMRGAQFISYEGSLHMSTLQNNHISKYDPLYLIDIELDKEAFDNALGQFNLYPDSGSFLMGLSNEFVIANQANGNALMPKNFVKNDRATTADGMGYSEISGRRYYFVYVKSDYLDMVLLRYIPQELVLTPIRNFYIWVWVFSIAALLIIIVFSLSTYRLIQKPLLDLMESFQKVENGNLQVSLFVDYKNEFGYLHKKFNHMVENLSALINQVYKQKIMMQRAELKQLQSQINPHFLYNSLFMINTMAQIGDENLIPFTKHLGQYYRFVTRNAEDYVTLWEEVVHARVYTEIQAMRYARRLQVDFGECLEQFVNIKVPRLIIQPIVENAFKYAVEMQKNSSIIRVNFAVADEEAQVIVEDNGTDVSDEKLRELEVSLGNNDDRQETTGLLNVHRRIQLVYGIDSGLAVGRSDLGGMKIVLKINPKRGTENVPTVDRGR